MAQWLALFLGKCGFESWWLHPLLPITTLWEKMWIETRAERRFARSGVLRRWWIVEEQFKWRWECKWRSNVFLYQNQGACWSPYFSDQQHPPFILFTILETVHVFPTQNDSEFITASLTGRQHYKCLGCRVVFRHCTPKNHGHYAGTTNFFLLVSGFSMLPSFFFYVICLNFM